MNTRYYFSYKNEPQFSLAERPSADFYNCINLINDIDYDELFLINNKQNMFIISEGPVNPIFEKKVIDTNNYNIIDLSQKPQINLFDLGSGISAFNWNNKVLCEVFSIILGTGEYNKILSRMLNSYTNSTGNLNFNYFFSNYIMKVTYQSQLPLEIRAKLENFFEQNDFLFGTSHSLSNMNYYYYNLNELSPELKEIYKILLSHKKHKSNMFFDFKIDDKHMSKKNGKYFCLKNKSYEFGNIIFNPPKNPKRKVYINEEKVSENNYVYNKFIGGVPFFDKGPFAEDVKKIFENIFPNFKEVLTLQALVNDPELAHFVYESDSKTICFFDTMKCDPEQIKEVLKTHSKNKIITFVAKNVYNQFKHWRDMLKSPIIDYYDFLAEHTENVFFINQENGHTKNMIVEIPYDFKDRANSGLS